MAEIVYIRNTVNPTLTQLLVEKVLSDRIEPLGFATNGFPTFPERPDVVGIESIPLSLTVQEFVDTLDFYRQNKHGVGPDLVQSSKPYFCGNARYKQVVLQGTDDHTHDEDGNVVGGDDWETTFNKTFGVSGNNVVVTGDVGDESAGLASPTPHVGTSISVSASSYSISSNTLTYTYHECEFTHQYTVDGDPGSPFTHVFTKRGSRACNTELVASDLESALTAWAASASAPGTGAAYGFKSESENSGNLQAAAAIWQATAPYYTTTPSAYNGSWPSFYNGNATLKVKVVTRRNQWCSVYADTGGYAFVPSGDFGMNEGTKSLSLSDECTGVCLDEFGEYSWPEATAASSWLPPEYTNAQAVAALQAASYKPFEADQYSLYPYYEDHAAEIAFVSRNGGEYRILLQFLSVDDYEWDEDLGDFVPVYSVFNQSYLITNPSTLIASRVASYPPVDYPFEPATRIYSIEKKLDDGTGAKWVKIASLDNSLGLPDPATKISNVITKKGVELLCMTRRRYPYYHGYYAYDGSARRFRRESFAVDQETPTHTAPSDGCASTRATGAMVLEGYREITAWQDTAVGREEVVVTSYTKTLGGVDVSESILVAEWETSTSFPGQPSSTDYHWKTVLDEYSVEPLTGASVSTSATSKVTTSGSGSAESRPCSLMRDLPWHRGEVTNVEWLSLTATNLVSGAYQTAVQNVQPPAAGYSKFVEGYYIEHYEP